jgi:predicted transcriptional regulator
MKNIMKNIENDVNYYVTEFRKTIENDSELIKELFDNDYADPDFFWEIFKQQSLLNMIEHNSPELTTLEFKEIHRKMFFKSIIETLDELKTQGLINGDETQGYELTPKGKSIIEKIPQVS